MPHSILQASLGAFGALKSRVPPFSKENKKKNGWIRTGIRQPNALVNKGADWISGDLEGYTSPMAINPYP